MATQTTQSNEKTVDLAGVAKAYRVDPKFIAHYQEALDARLPVAGKMPPCSKAQWRVSDVKAIVKARQELTKPKKQPKAEPEKPARESFQRHESAEEPAASTTEAVTA